MKGETIKKIVFVALLSGVFLSSALAEDFLARVSNGALSDNSAGVRELTMEEAKQVVGGYYVSKVVSVGIREAAVYAILSFNAVELGIDYGGEIAYDKNGNFSFERSGICSAGVLYCYMFNDTRTHYQQSNIRLRELMNIVGDPITNHLAFTAKANIYYNRKGERLMMFSYGVGIINSTIGSFAKMPTHLLDTNFVAKDLAATQKGRVVQYLIEKYGK